MKIEYVVKQSENSMMLKELIKKKLYVSTILSNKLKTSNSIFVNDNPVFVNYILKTGDNICLDLDNMNNVLEKSSFLDKFTTFDYDLDILFEDEYLLIINKPSNMYIHPCTNDKTTTLSNAVANYLSSKGINSIHIVTRLDKNTSGVCIFTKNEYIQELFLKKKNTINISKEYLCFVNGIVESNEGIIEKNIARKKGSIITRCISENGVYAKTKYEVIKRFYNTNFTFLKIKLYTGRTHQIRVHLASIGHVILGDTLYADEYNLKNIDKYISRTALHAFKITFNHPITSENLCIISNLPEDIAKLE